MNQRALAKAEWAKRCADSNPRRLWAEPLSSLADAIIALAQGERCDDPYPHGQALWCRLPMGHTGAHDGGTAARWGPKPTEPSELSDAELWQAARTVMGYETGNEHYPPLLERMLDWLAEQDEPVRLYQFTDGSTDVELIALHEGATDADNAHFGGDTPTRAVALAIVKVGQQ